MPACSSSNLKHGDFRTAIKTQLRADITDPWIHIERAGDCFEMSHVISAHPKRQQNRTVKRNPDLPAVGMAGKDEIEFVRLHPFHKQRIMNQQDIFAARIGRGNVRNAPMQNKWPRSGRFFHPPSPSFVNPSASLRRCPQKNGQFR